MLTSTAPLATVAVGAQAVRYRATGTSPQLPLLLLHGWGGSSRYWLPTIAALGPSRALIAPDLPGFGDSPPLPGPVTAPILADFVVGLADALGLEQFDLNGHSFCASVAVHLAARHPSRVRRLVLTCLSTFRNERERRVVERIHHVLALWLALRRPWMAQRRGFYRAVASRFFYRAPADDALLSAAVADFLKMDRRTAIETAAGSGDAAIHQAFAAVGCPTLVIGARQDRIMPPAGTPEVARLIPGSQLAWIERCGHLPMLERPAVYHRLLQQFLDRPSATRTYNPEGRPKLNREGREGREA